VTPDQKGSIAEAEIAAAAVRHGVGVLRPLNDGLRYDLMFDLHPRLLRVQCKWAARRGDVIVVNARTCRRSAKGYIHGCYSADEVDMIGVYCLDVDRCYLIPISYVAERPTLRIRLGPTRNNQARGVNWAKDFEFAATLSRLVGP
jgi:PD-(D/E)XK endonuclease